MNNKQINLPSLYEEAKKLISLVITASLIAVFVILINDSFGTAAAIFGSIALILAAHILNNAAKTRIDHFRNDMQKQPQTPRPSPNN
jgi:diacylglycerol kinase